MRTRAFDRAIPRAPMTVAFEEAGEPRNYGAVANISEGGVCVWTAANFDVGQKLSLRLSAARQPQPLEARAVVVWGVGDPARDTRTRRYGLQWVAPTDVYRGQLRHLLST